MTAPAHSLVGDNPFGSAVIGANVGSSFRWTNGADAVGAGEFPNAH